MTARYLIAPLAGLLAFAVAACVDVTPPPADVTDDVTEPVATSPTRVRFETTMGDILIELEDDAAPITVANFLQYVEDGFTTAPTISARPSSTASSWDSSPRAAGSLRSWSKKKPATPSPIEADNGLSNERGTLSMAQTSDPDSGTSQFFVNLVDNGCLDFTIVPDPACPSHTADGFPGHTVFARIIEGMDVVDAIAAVETVPTEAVVITSAAVIPE